MAVVGDAYIVVHAITKNYEKEMKSAAQQFNSLIKTGYFVGPAISGAVSALSDLVSGLFAVGSAVGAATPALVALPGFLAAIAQGAITAKVAFGGVGKAISAINKSKTSPGKDNSKQIEDARRRLAQVYQRAADTMATANDKVRQSQIALNLAYKAGAESLQQLGFNSEDAALAQERAAIQLERAREELMRSQDLPINDRGRREALLAFKEAELGYRKSVDAVNDLAKQQEYAAKTGIEGTSEVLKAKKDLSVAEADRAKQERDNAQNIAEAQRQLANALATTGAANKAVAQAMKDLSPEAQKFAKYMAGLKPVMLELRAAAGANLFGPLQLAMQNIVDKLVPVLKPILQGMGGVIGYVAYQFSHMLTNAKNLDIIGRVFGDKNLTTFRKIGIAFMNIVDSLLNVLDAAQPLVTVFSNVVVKFTEMLRISTSVQTSTGLMSDKFLKAGKIAGQIGGALKSAWNAFKELGGAAVDAGLKIINYFKGSMDRLKQFAEAGKQTGDLQAMFGRIADNFIAISAVIGKTIAVFFALGGNTGVKTFAEALMPLPEILGKIAYHLTGTGDIFAQFILNFAKMTSVFTETGGIQNFFGVLNQILKVVAAIFSNEIVQRIFLFAAQVHGVTLALGVMFMVLNKLKLIFMAKLLFAPVTLLKYLVAADGLSKSLMTLTRNIEALTKWQLRYNAMVAAGTRLQLRTMFASAWVAVKQYTLALKELIAVKVTYLAINFKLWMIQTRNTLSTLTWAGAMNIAKNAAVKFGAFMFAPIIAMKQFTAAIWENTVALLANPITGPLTIAIAAVVVVVGALVAIFIAAYKASKPLQDAVAGIGKAVSGVLSDGLDAITKQFQNLIPGVKSMADVFKKVGDWIAKYIIPPIQWLITSTLRIWIAQIILGIGALIAVFKLVGAVIMAVVGIFTGDFTPALELLKGAWNSVVGAITSAVNMIIDVINTLNLFGDDIPHLADDFGKLSTEADTNAKKQDEVRTASEKARKAFQEQSAAAGDLYRDYGSLNNIMNKINGALSSAFDAATRKARALIEVAKSAKTLNDAENTLKDSLKGQNKLTVDSKAALADFASAYLDAAKTAIEAGKSQDEVAKIIDQGKDAFVRNATAVLGSADAAEKLAKAYGLTPDTLKKTFKVTGLGDLQAAAQALKDMRDAYDKRIKAGARVSEGVEDVIQKREAALGKMMTALFGRGQTKDSPLYVSIQDDATKGNSGKNAIGGAVTKGGSYLVGEQGPEIFEPNTSGRILTNAETEKTLVGAGTNTNVTMNVYPSASMDEREIAAIASRNIAWSLRRGN